MKIERPKDQIYFTGQYQELSDTELLRLAAEGGLVPEADVALRSELKRRHLSVRDARGMKQQMLQAKLQIQVGTNPYSRGTGLRFRGERHLHESGTTRAGVVATRWIEFIYMPLIPLGSYKVVRSRRDGAATVIGKTKLQWDQVWRGWGRAVLVALGYVALISAFVLWGKLRS